jgi:hypothetical protein
MRRGKLGKIILALGGAGGLAWSVLGAIGNLETGRQLFENRGRITKVIADLVFSRWLGPLVALICFMGIATLFVLERLKGSKRIVAPPSPTQAAPTRLTLHDLFKRDFPTSLGFSEKRTLMFQTGNTQSSLQIECVICAEHDANSSFLSIYVPTSPITYDACAHLSDGYKLTLDGVKSKVAVESKMPGDSDATALNELTFSGRIFIYHVDPLRLEQLASLTQLYKSKDLSVRFRGTDYLLYQRAVEARN